MPWIEIALPGILLLTKFLLKLFVDRTASLPDLISAVFALPVDVVFLSASLLAGHVIASKAGDVRQGLLWFITCICLSLIVVFVWRRSETLFGRDSFWGAGSLALVNIAVSATMLIVALSLLSAGAST